MRIVNALRNMSYEKLSTIIHVEEVTINTSNSFNEISRCKHTIKAITAEQFRRAELIPTEKLHNDLNF